MKIAIYGKGGIGKSTISANLSAAFAQMGKRVLQIGCDPKHDSTRLLLGGKSIVTALDYMKNTPATLHRLDDVLHIGYGGIVCAEAGGPEPGVGCAGRGILSTFALFERLGLEMDAFDVVLYDVLGDVVCGGFAVPLRRDFADRIYVVTSEEFMSLYAANNILKGVKNFEAKQEEGRLAGLILNSRGSREDRRPVERFSRRVALPIRQIVPRSDRFRRAEMAEKTVVEAFPDAMEAKVFHDLALDLLENDRVYPARFLDENCLESEIFTNQPSTAGMASVGAVKFQKRGIVSDFEAFQDKNKHQTHEKRRDKEPQMKEKEPRLFLSKGLLNREPLHGCAFSGALATTTQIRDAVTVAHGPKSCTYIAGQAIVSAGFRLYTREGILLESQVTPAVISSDMDEADVIYGGKERLINTLEQAMNRNPKALFLLTTCPSGVIGDDPDAAVEEIRKRYPDVPVIPITTDGNLRGDYMQGVINACMEGVTPLMDTTEMDTTQIDLSKTDTTKTDTIETDTTLRCVNVFAEKNIAFNAESNFNTVVELLRALNIGVNCRFVRNTSVDQLKDFIKAPLNLPAYTDYLGRLMADFIRGRLGRPTAERPFPVGFEETTAWIQEIARFFDTDTEADAEALIQRHRYHYEVQIARYRRTLEGRRLMILTYIHNVDWMVEVARDLGMEVVKVGILNFSQDNLFVTRYPGCFDVETDYDPAQRDDDLSRLKPDLLLGNYTPKNMPFPLHVDIIPMCPDVGFYGGLTFARRWATLLKSPVMEGWKNDAD